MLQDSGLKARSVRGTMVLGTGVMFERMLRLIRNIILTRMLVPDEFGLVAIVITASVAFEAIAEVGVRQSVIHNKRGSETEYLNVAWWFQALRGLCLFVIAFWAAPLIASFYDNPQLLAMLRVAFVAILFNGFISPRVYALEKKIQFAKLVFLFQGSGLFGTLVSFGIVFFVVQSAWALVIGFVVEAAFKFFLSFILVPFMPGIKIDKDSLIDLLKYSRRMLGVPILAVIAFQMDVLVLGKVVSEEQVGMYWLTLQLALYVNVLFSNVIYPILLPVFSEKQNDEESLGAAARKVTTFAAILGVPITTFLVICAGPILSTIYGSKYRAVAIPFGLLCIYSLVRMQGSVLSQIYFAIGKPNLHRRFVILRLAMLILLLYPAIVQFGILGAAVVVLLANLTGLCMQVFWMRKPIGLRFNEYAYCWIPGLRLAVIVLLPVALLRFFKDGTLFLDIVVGGLACSAACIIGLLSLRRSSRKIHIVSSESTRIG